MIGIAPILYELHRSLERRLQRGFTKLHQEMLDAKAPCGASEGEQDQVTPGAGSHKDILKLLEDYSNGMDRKLRVFLNIVLVIVGIQVAIGAWLIWDINKRIANRIPTNAQYQLMVEGAKKLEGGP